MLRHLALIPDGNRRWARAHGLSVRAGHAAGIARLPALAPCAWEAGVEVLSFWWGSPANLQLRAPEEVEGIVDVLKQALQGPVLEAAQAAGAGVELIGGWAKTCPELADAAAALPRPRAGRPRLCILMAYDGRDEIRAAAEALGGAGSDAEHFTQALWTGHLPPVDLVLRTGGEPHLSAGFMLWSIAEAQLYFSPKLWPDFSTEDLHQAIAHSRGTVRRRGR